MCAWLPRDFLQNPAASLPSSVSEQYEIQPSCWTLLTASRNSFLTMSFVQFFIFLPSWKLVPSWASPTCYFTRAHHYLFKWPPGSFASKASLKPFWNTPTALLRPFTSPISWRNSLRAPCTDWFDWTHPRLYVWTHDSLMTGVIPSANSKPVFIWWESVGSLQTRQFQSLSNRLTLQMWGPVPYRYSRSSCPLSLVSIVSHVRWW